MDELSNMRLLTDRLIDTRQEEIVRSFVKRESVFVTHSSSSESLG